MIIDTRQAYQDDLQRQRLDYYDNWLPEGYEVIKSDPALQVRGVIKIGNECRAYNTYGDLMTLTPKECSYYLAQSGRVHKSQSQIQTPNNQALRETIPPRETIRHDNTTATTTTDGNL